MELNEGEQSHDESAPAHAGNFRRRLGSLVDGSVRRAVDTDADPAKAADSRDIECSSSDDFHDARSRRDISGLSGLS